MRKNNQIKRILLTVAIGAVLLFIFFFATSSITKYTGYFVIPTDEENKKDFESCLSEQDITLYINTNSPENILKNLNVKEYLEYFKIINCHRENSECIGPVSEPVWNINSNSIGGDISIEELERLSGC